MFLFKVVLSKCFNSPYLQEDRSEKKVLKNKKRIKGKSVKVKMGKRGKGEWDKGLKGKKGKETKRAKRQKGKGFK